MGADEQLRDLVSLKARIVWVPDHDLGIASLAAAGRTGGEMLGADFAHGGQGELRILGCRCRTST